MRPQKNRGGTLKETVLWTNPSPTSAMDNRTLTLSDNLSKYDYLKCVYRYSTSNANEYAFMISTEEFQKTANGVIEWACANINPNGEARTRYARRGSDTSISVTRAWSGGSSSSYTTDAIPIAFYGLK